MMRATYAVLLLGMFLVGSLLVPYDAAIRGNASKPAAIQSSQSVSRFVLPTGIGQMDFPDQWDNSLSYVLYDQTVQLPGTAGLDLHWIRLQAPSGEFVKPGTRWLNISLEPQTPMAAESSLYFNHVSADDRRGSHAMDGGGSIRLRLEEEQNDWAPDQDSRWIFEAAHDGVTTLPVRIVIAGARPAGPLPSIVLYEDRWDASGTYTVFDQTDRLAQAQILRNTVSLPENRAPQRLNLRGMPTTDVEQLVITAHFNFTTSQDLQYQPLLSWRSPRAGLFAYERTNMPPQAADAQSGRFQWTIDVEPNMWDTLFASRTRWIMDINWYGESSQYYMEGRYHLTVVALRSNPSED